MVAGVWTGVGLSNLKIPDPDLDSKILEQERSRGLKNDSGCLWCLGSVTRRAGDSVAPLWRSSAGWMPARIGRLSAGVGRRHPVTIRKASLMAGSLRPLWALRHQTGAQYSAVECTSRAIRTVVAVCRFAAPAPQPEPASRLRSATCDVCFLRSDSRCRRCVSGLSNVTPGYLAGGRRAGFRCCSWLSAHD